MVAAMRMLVLVLLAACGDRSPSTPAPGPEPRQATPPKRAVSGDRFRDMLAELEADPRIVVERAFIGRPATPAAIEQAQRVLGAQLAPEILDFYRKHDGISIRWVFAEDARPGDRKRANTPFTEIDSSNTASGLIHFMPIDEVFVSADRYEGELWSAAQANLDELTKVGTRRYKHLDFRKGLRPFDYYSDFSMAAFFVGGHDANPPVLLGDDHGADWTTSGGGDFTAYVDGVLALRGSVHGRRTFMLSVLSETLGWQFAVEHWRKAPPTLDQVLAWSRRGRDDDESWLVDVEPLLEASTDPKARRLLRELRE